MFEEKNILVTGATGFVGACLTHRLIKGKDNIHIILRKSSDAWRIKDILKKLKLHYVDLINRQQVVQEVKKIKPKIIYHLATYGGYHFQKEPKKILETNIFSTLNLLSACAETGFDAFVNTGSSSEYGTKSKPMSEGDLLEPGTYYGIAKASQTLLCQYLAKNDNLPVATLRLFSPYGPYEEPTRLIPVLINSCLTGKELNLISPKVVRDFNFIDDVINAFLKVPSKINKLSGQIINIADGKQRTLKEVVNIITANIPCRSKVNWEMEKVGRPYDTDIWQANISKARKLLNWRPKYSLEKGLLKTIIWFEKNREKFGDKYVIK